MFVALAFLFPSRIAIYIYVKRICYYHSTDISPYEEFFEVAVVGLRIGCGLWIGYVLGFNLENIV